VLILSGLIYFKDGCYSIGFYFILKRFYLTLATEALSWLDLDLLRFVVDFYCYFFLGL